MLVEMKYKHKKTNKLSVAIFIVPHNSIPLKSIETKYDLSGLEILEINCRSLDEALILDSGGFIMLEKECYKPDEVLEEMTKFLENQRPPDRECAEILEKNLWEFV